MRWDTIAMLLKLIAHVPSAVGLFILFMQAFGWPIAIAISLFAFVMGWLSGWCMTRQLAEDAKKSPFAYLALIKKELGNTEE